MFWAKPTAAKNQKHEPKPTKLNQNTKSTRKRLEISYDTTIYYQMNITHHKNINLNIINMLKPNQITPRTHQKPICLKTWNWKQNDLELKQIDLETY
jgi:hypothetical protein